MQHRWLILVCLAPVACTPVADPAIAQATPCPVPEVTPVAHVQGVLRTTGNDLDWALDGPGFFPVVDPATGKGYYLRNGAFKVTDQGAIVTRNGPEYQLAPNIMVLPPPNPFRVSRDGFVLVSKEAFDQMRSGSQPPAEPAPLPTLDPSKPYVICWPSCPPVPESLHPVGQVSVAVFPNPKGLKALANGLFDAGDLKATGCPVFGPPGLSAQSTVPPEQRAWYTTGDLIAGAVEETTDTTAASPQAQ